MHHVSLHWGVEAIPKRVHGEQKRGCSWDLEEYIGKAGRPQLPGYYYLRLRVLARKVPVPSPALPPLLLHRHRQEIDLARCLPEG